MHVCDSEAGTFARVTASSSQPPVGGVAQPCHSSAPCCPAAAGCFFLFRFFRRFFFLPPFGSSPPPPSSASIISCSLRSAAAAVSGPSYSIDSRNLRLCALSIPDGAGREVVLLGRAGRHGRQVCAAGAGRGGMGEGVEGRGRVTVCPVYLGHKPLDLLHTERVLLQPEKSAHRPCARLQAQCGPGGGG